MAQKDLNIENGVHVKIMTVHELAIIIIKDYCTNLLGVQVYNL